MRVLLVDDHRIMREGLRAILEREGMTVVAEAETGRGALAMAARHRPDVVIMDISMPDLNGVDATRQLLSETPSASVIGLSMNGDRKFVRAMLAAGAAGYVLKTSAKEELLQAIRETANGRKYVSPAVAVFVEGTVDSLDPSSPKTKTSSVVQFLTPREREVLQLLAEGGSSKSIASKLQVAVSTVETHRHQLMGKLDLHTVAELTKFAIREGLTSTG